MKYIFLLVILGIAQSIFAQNYLWQSKIDSVEKEAYYDIQISPEIASRIKPDFSDVRIYNQDAKEIPYIHKVEEPVLYSTLFKEYEIIKKEHQKRWGYTRIVIHNKNKGEITNFCVRIKNADVQKWLKLNGSDDNENWYIIKNNYIYQSLENNNETSEIRVLNFPLSNYEYYELLISDYFDKPLNILEVGYYDTKTETGKYSEIEQLKFLQKDSTQVKKSIVNIEFSEKKNIDKIKFDIEGPEFYLREAALMVQKVTRDKNNNKEYYFETIKNFNLSSFSLNTIYLNHIHQKNLYIEIQNNDDEPIKVKQIVATQLNNYLTAKLLPQNSYFLRYDDKESEAPVYDLKFFKDSLSNNLPVVRSIKSVKLNEGDTNKESTILAVDSVYLWTIIVAVILILGYMTMNMLKDMKKKQSQNIDE